jgi:hypothetical protein
MAGHAWVSKHVLYHIQSERCDPRLTYFIRSDLEAEDWCTYDARVPNYYNWTGAAHHNTHLATWALSFDLVPSSKQKIIIITIII